jgi:hypothetical protein
MMYHIKTVTSCVHVFLYLYQFHGCERHFEEQNHILVISNKSVIHERKTFRPITDLPKICAKYLKMAKKGFGYKNRLQIF